jgi:hypothetical protein
MLNAKSLAGALALTLLAATDARAQEVRAETPAAPAVAAISRARAMVLLDDGLEAYNRELLAASCDPAQANALVNEVKQAWPVSVLTFRDAPYGLDVPDADAIAKALGIVDLARKEMGSCAAAAADDFSLDQASAVPLAGAVGETFFPAQSALVRGLANFMVSRARDEAVFSALIHLRDAVGGHKLVTVGMPLSWGLMSRLEHTSYQTLLPTVRTTFAEDLEALPVQLNSPELRAAMGWADGTPPYVQLVAVAFQRGLEIRSSGVPPITAVQNLLEVSSDELADDHLRGVVHLVGLAAREYAVGGRDTLVQQLAATGSANLRRYFVAFVVHDAVQLGDFEQTARAGLLARAKEAEGQIVHLLEQVHSLRQTMRALEEGGDRAERVERAMVGIGSMLQVVNAGRRFLPLDAAPQTNAFDRAMQHALTLHQAVIDRDYSRIVAWLATSDELASRVNDDVLKYLAFASSLASAEDADEVELALQAAAAPVGSYRAKRYQAPQAGTAAPQGWREKFKPQSISVVGYLGLRAGREGTHDTPVLSGDSWFAGAALPVGIEFSSAFPLGALSLFAPLIDLGTVASARWGGSEDTATEIGFEQVFAPGLFLVWNVGGVPLSAGAGVQVVPNLRSGAGGEGERDAVRFGAFIGVDAPLFHFRFRRSAPAAPAEAQ